MAQKGKGQVLLLHGHGRTGASMLALGLALRHAGYATRAPSYGIGRSLPAILDRLAPTLGALQDKGAGPLHIVTHSLGGLLARALIRRQRPARLGRVVMLGPPHGGSELADAITRWQLAPAILGPVAPFLVTDRPADAEALLGPVDYPLGIIAGSRGGRLIPPALLPRPHDGKVTVGATRLAGMAEHLVLPVGHATMMLEPMVIAAVLSFLDTGAFRRAPADQA